jgi:nucleoid-associated protein YejK
MYLYEFKHQGTVYNIITEIAGRYGITVKEFFNGDLISSSVTLNSAGQNRILLSEFPGNCSSLILSNIQNNFYTSEISQYMKNNLNATIEICLALRYGALFVSGTSRHMSDFLIKEYGFEVILDKLMNPHSGSLNYFLVKKFDYAIKEEHVEEEDIDDNEDLEEDGESFPIEEDLEDE